MATVEIYCDCKVHEIGTAKLDLYLLRWENIDAILKGEAKCKYCGLLLKEVGDKGCLTKGQADKINEDITKQFIGE